MKSKQTLFNWMPGKAFDRCTARIYRNAANPGVYMHPDSTSYVLVDASNEEKPTNYWQTPDGQKVYLCSINGIGEVRWWVHSAYDSMEYYSETEQAAMRHFQLEYPD